MIKIVITDEVTSESMIDVAETIGSVRRQLVKQLLYGATSEHTRKLDALYLAERTLRHLAGEV